MPKLRPFCAPVLYAASFQQLLKQIEIHRRAIMIFCLGKQSGEPQSFAGPKQACCLWWTKKRTRQWMMYNIYMHSQACYIFFRGPVKTIRTESNSTWVQDLMFELLLTKTFVPSLALQQQGSVVHNHRGFSTQNIRSLTEAFYFYPHIKMMLLAQKSTMRWKRWPVSWQTDFAHALLCWVKWVLANSSCSLLCTRKNQYSTD